MTMFEEVYDHFDIENAASHYMRIGHPDEMRVTVDGQELNGEDYLNQFHPPRSGKILKFLTVFDSYGLNRDFEYFLPHGKRSCW